MDAMRRSGMESGKPVTFQTFVIDMDKLSLRQMALKPGTPILLLSFSLAV